MEVWEIVLGIGALTFGVVVTALCLGSIRRMSRAEPDLKAVDRFINAQKSTSPENETPTDGQGNSEDE